MTKCKTKRKTKAAPLTEWLYTRKGKQRKRPGHRLYILCLGLRISHIRKIFKLRQYNYNSEDKGGMKPNIGLTKRRSKITDKTFFSVITFCASQCPAELRELTVLKLTCFHQVAISPFREIIAISLYSSQPWQMKSDIQPFFFLSWLSHNIWNEVTLLSL